MLFPPAVLFAPIVVALLALFPPTLLPLLLPLELNKCMLGPRPFVREEGRACPYEVDEYTDPASLVAEPSEEGGRDEMDAIEGFSVGMAGEERRRVTSAAVALRSTKTSQSSSAGFSVRRRGGGERGVSRRGAHHPRECSRRRSRGTAD